MNLKQLLNRFIFYYNSLRSESLRLNQNQKLRKNLIYKYNFLLKTDKEFKEILSNFNILRGDILSTYKEVYAFMLSYYEVKNNPIQCYTAENESHNFQLRYVYENEEWALTHRYLENNFWKCKIHLFRFKTVDEAKNFFKNYVSTFGINESNIGIIND